MSDYSYNQKLINDMFADANMLDMIDPHHSFDELDKYIRAITNEIYFLNKKSAINLQIIMEAYRNQYYEDKKKEPNINQTGADSTTEQSKWINFMYDLNTDYKNMMLEEIRKIITDDMILR